MFKTALDKLKALLVFVNSMAYTYGLEMILGDWNFNYRTLFTLTVHLYAAWLCFYSFYVTFNTLEFITMISGFAFIISVRFINILVFV